MCIQNGKSVAMARTYVRFCSYYSISIAFWVRSFVCLPNRLRFEKMVKNITVKNKEKNVVCGVEIRGKVMTRCLSEILRDKRLSFKRITTRQESKFQLTYRFFFLGDQMISFVKFVFENITTGNDYPVQSGFFLIQSFGHSNNTFSC